MEERTQTIVLSRYVKRLREDAIPEQQKRMHKTVNNKSYAQEGWTLDIGTPGPAKRYWDQDTNDWALKETTLEWKNVDSDRPGYHKYEMYFTLAWRQIRPDLVQNEAHGPKMILHLSTVCGMRENGNWTLDTVDGEEWEPPVTDLLGNSGKQYMGYYEVVIPDDFESYFDHLFGLDDQIAQLKSALIAGVNSDWEMRYNVKLIGPPGCGKSAICAALKNALGEDAVMEFDATSTTAAGALKNISQREILPRVLITEEAEKQEQESSKWMLAALDQRAEIRKNTYRDQIEMETKLFGVCTVNDEDAFDKMHAGALSDRFQHAIYFQRPGRDLLWKILEREVKLYPGGDLAWIDPCLDYLEEVNDPKIGPRKAIALCISGGEAWVSGEYAKMLRRTAKTPIKDYSDVSFEDMDFQEMAG